MTLKWIAAVGLGLLATGARAQTNSATPTPKAQAAPKAQKDSPKPQSDAPKSAQDAPKTDKDKVSYGIGVQLGKGFKNQGMDIDAAMLLKGLKDSMSGSKLDMTDEELAATMNGLQEEMKRKQMEERAAVSDTNKKAGEAFLAENGKKEGVVTQPSGLQYKVLKAADGKKPADGDSVVCQYRGTLVDGTEFDSSYKSGSPATFQVNGLIPGIHEALTLMNVGSKVQFVVPASLAYGENGAGNAIGPNSTLVFEIELLSIQDKNAPVAPGTPAPGK